MRIITTMWRKKVSKLYIITGGTINKIAPHFAISAPAYGKIGEQIYKSLNLLKEVEVVLIKTKMASSNFCHESIANAGLKHIETNEDLRTFIQYLNTEKDTFGIILSSAVADFTIDLPKELQGTRLSSSKEMEVTLKPAPKILQEIRKDIFTVSFKTLYNETNENKAFKNSEHSDIIFVNDIGKKTNGLVIRDKIHWQSSRKETIDLLCKAIYSKLNLVSRFCVKCGEYVPLTIKEALAPCPSCYAKRPSIISYKTILDYKYGINDN